MYNLCLYQEHEKYKVHSKYEIQMQLIHSLSILSALWLCTQKSCFISFLNTILKFLNLDICYVKIWFFDDKNVDWIFSFKNCTWCKSGYGACSSLARLSAYINFKILCNPKKSTPHNNHNFEFVPPQKH